MEQARFRKLLTTYFNSSELNSLCFDLGINYENLPGETLDDKGRELINFCHRYSLITVLIEQCCKLRPVVFWPEPQQLIDSLNRASESFPSNPENTTNSTSLHQTVQGGYSAVSSHGGQSTVNVTNIHSIPKDDAATLLVQGIQLVEARAYEQAINSLDSAVKLEPRNSRIYFYLAIASLKGNRPKSLSMATVQKIEGYLRTTINLAPQFGQAYVFLALLKYDYYTMNGMFDRPPTVLDLLNHPWTITKEQVRELLTYIKAPNNKVWEWLKSL